MIETRRLSKTYGETVAVQDLTICVCPGEIVGFLGPNGAGKSTTMRIVAGLLRPSSGVAVVAGFDVVQEPLQVKRRIGYVPESPRLYDHLSAFEHVQLLARLHDLDASTADHRCAELFDLFDLTSLADERLHALSKGLRQKVALAAALIHRPEVLILDEPLDGLDVESAMVFKALLKELAGAHTTILLSSHMLDSVERIATRVVIINKGRQVAAGSAAELCALWGAGTLEAVFRQVTGVRDPDVRAALALAGLRRNEYGAGA